MPLKTTPWDATRYLQTGQDIAAYLSAVLEDGDPALLKAALGDIARSKGIAMTPKRHHRASRSKGFNRR